MALFSMAMKLLLHLQHHIYAVATTTTTIIILTVASMINKSTAAVQ
jgi:hypothetical protein